MDSGKSLKLALLIRNRSRGWLADELGITHQAVANLCNKPSMTMKSLNKLSILLEYKPSEFIALSETN